MSNQKPLCDLCGDTGRVMVMRSIGGRQHPFVRPCPNCPPSETVNDAMDNAQERRRTAAQEPKP